MPESTARQPAASGPDPSGLRFQTRRIGVIAAGHAAHDTFTAFLPPLLPLFMVSMELSKTAAGMLAVSLQLPWLLQPLIGHLADRKHARTIVILAPTASAVTMSLLGMAPAYFVLVLLLIGAGLSSAAFHAVGPAMVSRLSGRFIGRGMGIWMVGGELGRTLGPVAAVTAVYYLTPTGLPWMMIGGVIASLLLASQLGRPDVAEDDSPGLPWRTLVRALGPLLLPLAGIMLARSFLVAALNLYLPIYLSERGSELWLAGVALTLLEGAGVVGALAGGWFSDRIGRRGMLAISLTSAPLLLVAFLNVSGWLQMVILIGLGMSALSVTPVIMAMVQESFPRNRALANGVYMLLSFAIRSVAIVGMGAFGDLAGLAVAYTWSAAAALLGLPLLLLVPRSPGKQPPAVNGGT